MNKKISMAFVALPSVVIIVYFSYINFDRPRISEIETRHFSVQNTEPNMSPRTSKETPTPSLEPVLEAEPATKSDQVPNFLATIQTIKNNLINKIEIGSFGALLIIDKDSSGSASAAYLWHDKGEVTLTQISIDKRTDIAKMQDNGDLKWVQQASNWSSLPKQWPLNSEGAATTLPNGAILFLSTLSLPSNIVPPDHRGLFQCASGDYIAIPNQIIELAECLVLKQEDDAILLQESKTSESTVIARRATLEHPLPKNLHEAESTWKILAEDGKPLLPSPMTRIGSNFSTPDIIILEDGTELYQWSTE